MRILSLAGPLFCLATMAYGADVEKWECAQYSGGAKISLSVDESGDYGSVVFAGKNQFALFHIVGLTRRWDFGPDNNFAIVLNPDETASYFDFAVEAKTKPSFLLKCRSTPASRPQVKKSKPAAAPAQNPAPPKA